MIRPLLNTALAISTVALAVGCARTVVEDTQPTDYNPNDLTAQLDFWHELPGRSAVSNDEGLHGVLLLFDGVDSTGSYEARVGALKDRGWLYKSFEEPGDLAMQRGTLASVLCKAMEIQGGFMMRLTNENPRYATRELAYLGIMPEGSQLMVVDGLDYLGVISRAQDYMVVQGLKQHARDLRKAGEEEEKQRQLGVPEGETRPGAGPEERDSDSRIR